MKNFITAVILMMALTACSGNTNNSGSTSSVPTSTQSPTQPASSTSGLETSGTTAPSHPPEGVDRQLDRSRLTNVFGFADEAGQHLLSLPPQEETKDAAVPIESLNTAIGEGGEVLSVKYLRQQEGDEQDSGRQTAQNFAHTQGALFEVVEGKAVPNQSYYLVNDMNFNLQALVPIHSMEPQEPPQSVQDEIAKARDRSLTHSWELATMDGDRHIYLVQFERQTDQMLASLVIDDAEQGLLFMDYPAVYDEGSTWRVDDQGEIVPEMFSFLFAADSAQGLVIGVKWMGAEGENLTLIQQKDKVFAETGLGASRYMSPV